MQLLFPTALQQEKLEFYAGNFVLNQMFFIGSLLPIQLEFNLLLVEKIYSTKQFWRILF